MPVDHALTRAVSQQAAARAAACTHARATIKHDDVFVVTHADSEIHPGCMCGQGVYYRDTRFLSGLTLTLAGRPLVKLSANTEHNFFSRVDAMNEAWQPAEGPFIRRETIHVNRTRVVDGAVRERIEVQNFNTVPVRATLALELRADFKDIFEVRGVFARSAHGTFFHPRVAGPGAELLYQGADGALRHTALTFGVAPDRLVPCAWPETHETGVRAEWDLTLAPRGGRWELALVVAPRIDGAGKDATPHAPVGPARLEALKHEAGAGLTGLTSTHHGFERFLGRGVADLLMLCTQTPEGPFPTAGIPWFACAFGRDALITAIQSLPLGPMFATAALRYLARHQGERLDGSREEEPGKILHELREGELAALGDVPHTPYYGTVDATPLWLVLLSETYRWTADVALVRDLWPHALRALAWLDTYGDADGDGFVEYARKHEKGLQNQGWKDSYNAVIHPDGTIPASPIALAEVQGYVYDAKRRMAELACVMGDPALASRLESEAEALKVRFNAAFWVEAGGYYAIALDGDKAPVLAKTSNPGHGLWSGIIADHRRAALAEDLVAPDMFSGWGIRTMSTACPNYNPLSYHNGTIWPHDNALIAKGMADHGFKHEANRVLTGLFETAGHFEYHRLPELFCGFERVGRLATPVPYPVACSPQAWAAGTPFMLLQAALGLIADAPKGVLHIDRPELPAWLPDVTLTALRVGPGEADLRFTRVHGETRCTVLAVRGDLRIEQG
jgi:glycogen debranching enzyme